MNTEKRWETCEKLTIKTPEWLQWRHSGDFIVKFEHISHLFVVFPLLTLGMYFLLCYVLFTTKLYLTKSKFYYFKFVLKSALSSLRQFLITESPLKMMKNTFYFTLKALLVLNFCLEFSVMSKNNFIRKIKLILNLMTSQPG